MLALLPGSHVSDHPDHRSVLVVILIRCIKRLEDKQSPVNHLQQRSTNLEKSSPGYKHALVVTADSNI